MKITKYKRGGDPAHVIEYQSAPGHVAVGKIGTNQDPPTELEQAWRDLRSECGSVYGQSGLTVREIRWSYPKDDDEEGVLIIGTVPHWSGDMKTELPKFAIRVVTAYDEIREKLHTERRYPSGLEALGETADRVRDALEKFVREGTQQMELGFTHEMMNAASEQIRSVANHDGVDSVTISGAGESVTLGKKDGE
ncbi:MAG: hypothetical protein WD492_12705 [Alkalispirochaeta sp.]